MTAATDLLWGIGRYGTNTYAGLGGSPPVGRAYAATPDARAVHAVPQAHAAALRPSGTATTPRTP